MGKKAANDTATCIPMQQSGMFFTCTPKPKMQLKKIKLKKKKSTNAFLSWGLPKIDVESKIWKDCIIPATQVAEAGELLEPGRWRLWWAEIVPLHSSLGDRARLHLNNNKTKWGSVWNIKREREREEWGDKDRKRQIRETEQKDLAQRPQEVLRNQCVQLHRINSL